MLEDFRKRRNHNVEKRANIMYHVHLIENVLLREFHLLFFLVAITSFIIFAEDGPYYYSS